MKPGRRFDPVTLQILWSRLISIADEAAAALLRTSFSTIVRESNDYATVLMDANGDSLAENSTGIPSFVGLLPRTLRHMLAEVPVEDLRPGDVLITNDPWMGTGHLLDITMASPIFRGGRIVAFAGATSHMPDIGGTLWSADCTEMYEEGIRIHPTRFLVGGRENRDVANFIRGNVRVADQVMGDIQAQITAQAVCARRVMEFLDDTGLDDLTELSAELQDRADRAMRKAISALPDGTWRGVVHADGYEEQETRIECAVTVEGDRLTVDYAGTSPQIARGLNSVMNYTYAYTVYPLKCALDPLTPRNEGSYRAVTVTAPEGSILNPTPPAPVNARHLTGLFLSGAVYQCLAQVVPGKVVADSASPSPRPVYTGRAPGGDRFSQVLFGSGGMGASAHADGLNTTAFPTNSGSGSIEAFESSAPIVVWKKDLLPDSGGPGRFRGGLGQEVELEVMTEEPVRLSLISDRMKHPPLGLDGGGAGAPALVRLQDGRTPHPKSRSQLRPGDRLLMHYGGGGGYGDPRERDPAAIERDLEDGYVTPEGAIRDYGRKG
ncbi:hydantoinase B/oxoprolinase family protein [Falsiroseomonas sp. CW058]|uniref:hydantoinase B/oxoprolinase family protein n=1 Tax=Falsiroseomonas sp. CW058 TaxID=3388664 RepID=UPI003D31BEEE